MKQKVTIPKVEFSLTPMAGFAFGNTNDFAPGLRRQLNWWKLNLYTESEYLIDFSSMDKNFYDAWAEITIAPADWIWMGISVQRTKLYETDLDVQRGVPIGVNAKFRSITTYIFIFNLGWDDSFGFVSIEAKF